LFSRPVPGIYIIENLINSRKYVGKSKQVEKRMKDPHLTPPDLAQDIKLHGKKNFNYEVLIYCEIWEIDRLEIEFIKYKHSHVSEGGYNLSTGGYGHSGAPVSEETRKKIGAANSNPSPETRWMLGSSNRGIPRAEEVKLKISLATKGMPKSEETKKKMSKSGQERKEKGVHRAKRKNTTSQYNGVCQYTVSGKYKYWNVCINLGNGKSYSKNYKTEIEAAIAYDEYVIKNGLTNPLNFKNEKDNDKVK
jgi:group I intron endonuclease